MKACCFRILITINVDDRSRFLGRDINDIKADLLVRCGSGTNQKKVDGHITPEAEEDGE